MNDEFKSNVSLIYVSSVHEIERSFINERTNERKTLDCIYKSRLPEES